MLIIINNRLINNKSLRLILKEKVLKNNKKPSPLAKLILEIHFMYNRNNYFFLLHYSHYKIHQKYFIPKNNYFQCLKPILSSGHILEAGKYTSKYTKILYHTNKDKLISNVRISRNVAHINNLSKQKVKPILALFSKELTTALQDEYREEANRIVNFLEFFKTILFSLY